MKRRRPWLILVSLLMSLPTHVSLSGCEKGEDQAPFISLERTEPAASPPARKRPEILKIAGAPMISAVEGYDYYQEMLQYMSANLHRGIHLVQRKTYHEINELLRSGDVDGGFVCSGAFIKDAEESGIEIVVVPHAGGKPYYRSYLIAGAHAPWEKLQDLRGRSFAFTDPLSLSGRFYILYRLKELDEDPDRFFSKTVYSGSHDNSIRGVASGEVDAASVDSLIYDYMRLRGAPAIAETRILERSEPLGIPPFVVSPHLEDDIRQGLQKVLLEMNRNPEGKKILGNLGLDGFYLPPPDLYDGVRRIVRNIESP